LVAAAITEFSMPISIIPESEADPEAEHEADPDPDPEPEADPTQDM
jgi:hypothetical protein